MSRATFSWVERSWLGRGARVPNGVFGVEGSGVGSRMHGTATPRPPVHRRSLRRSRDIDVCLVEILLPYGRDCHVVGLLAMGMIHLIPLTVTVKLLSRWFVVNDFIHFLDCFRAK